MVFYGELAYGLRAGVYGTIYHIGWGQESGYLEWPVPAEPRGCGRRGLQLTVESQSRGVLVLPKMTAENTPGVLLLSVGGVF